MSFKKRILFKKSISLKKKVFLFFTNEKIISIRGKHFCKKKRGKNRYNQVNAIDSRKIDPLKNQLQIG